MAFDLTPIRTSSQDNRVIDKIWEACEEAMSAGWTVEKFIKEFKVSWTQAADDEAKAKKYPLDRLRME